MTDKKTEALKLALEALEAEHSAVYGTSRTARAITAIREALAEQPAQQQEPVAWWLHGTDHVEFEKHGYHDGHEWTPIYTSPPASKPWVGLTNQELIDLTAIYSGAPLYCAIEAKLREKNT